MDLTTKLSLSTLSSHNCPTHLPLPFFPKHSTISGRTHLNHIQARINYDVLNWQLGTILYFFGGKCYYQIAWGTTSLPEKRKIKAALNMTNCAKMFQTKAINKYNILVQAKQEVTFCSKCVALDFCKNAFEIWWDCDWLSTIRWDVFFHFLQKLITDAETYESIKSCSYILFSQGVVKKNSIFIQRPFFIILISALTVCCHCHTSHGGFVEASKFFSRLCL